MDEEENKRSRLAGAGFDQSMCTRNHLHSNIFRRDYSEIQCRVESPNRGGLVEPCFHEETHRSRAIKRPTERDK